MASMNSLIPPERRIFVGGFPTGMKEVDARQLLFTAVTDVLGRTAADVIQSMLFAPNGPHIFLGFHFANDATLVLQRLSNYRMIGPPCFFLQVERPRNYLPLLTSTSFNPIVPSVVSPPSAQVRTASVMINMAAAAAAAQAAAATHVATHNNPMFSYAAERTRASMQSITSSALLETEPEPQGDETGGGEKDQQHQQNGINSAAEMQLLRTEIGRLQREVAAVHQSAIAAHADAARVRADIAVAYKAAEAAHRWVTNASMAANSARQDTMEVSRRDAQQQYQTHEDIHRWSQQQHAAELQQLQSVIEEMRHERQQAQVVLATLHAQLTKERHLVARHAQTNATLADKLDSSEKALLQLQRCVNPDPSTTPSTLWHTNSTHPNILLHPTNNNTQQQQQQQSQQPQQPQQPQQQQPQHPQQQHPQPQQRQQKNQELENVQLVDQLFGSASPTDSLFVRHGIITSRDCGQCVANLGQVMGLHLVRHPTQGTFYWVKCASVEHACQSMVALAKFIREHSPTQTSPAPTDIAFANRPRRVA